MTAVCHCIGSLATGNAGFFIPIKITSINSLMPTEHIVNKSSTSMWVTE